MTQRRQAVLLGPMAGALILGGGCGGAEPTADLTLGTASRSIVGGMADSDDPAVVIIRWRSGALCTGTIVDQTHVLTAAHCIGDFGSNASNVTVDCGPTGSDCKMAVSKLVANPTFSESDYFAHDHAVITLAQPTNIPPKPLPSAALGASNIGKMMRFVGYGNMGSGPAGRQKQVGMATIQKFNSDQTSVEMGGPQYMCAGDSGGPAFYPPGPGEAVVATVSGYSSGGGCGQPGWYSLVYPDLPWIMAQGVMPGSGEGGSSGGGGAAGASGSAGTSGASGTGGPAGTGGSPGATTTTGQTAGGGCEVDPQSRAQERATVLVLLWFALVLTSRRKRT